MAKNERKTENLVRDDLRDLGYYDVGNDIQVEEQKSHIESVKRAMKAASKSGGEGSGSPEFIITSPSATDFLVLVECKADPKDHGSGRVADIVAAAALHESTGAKARIIKRFGEDGALHYAQAQPAILM